MDKERPSGTPLTGPCFYGTFDQRRSIARWEHAGWTFLHWTEVPRMVAVIENTIGDVAFIDQEGRAWTGPKFSRAKPVPLEQYPPLGDDYWE